MLKSLHSEKQTWWWGTSLTASLPSESAYVQDWFVCCKPPHWLQCKRGGEYFKWCFTKHVQCVYSFQNKLMADTITGSCTNSPVSEAYQAICSLSSQCVCTVTPACCLWGGHWGKGPSSLIFLPMLTKSVLGKRQATGGRMKPLGSASPHKSTYASTAGQIWCWSLPVLKTNEAVAIGL